MQTSLLAPSYNTITNSNTTVVLHRQVELGSTTLQYKSQFSEDRCLLEIKTVAANKGDKSALAMPSRF